MNYKKSVLSLSSLLSTPLSIPLASLLYNVPYNPRKVYPSSTKENSRLLISQLFNVSSYAQLISSRLRNSRRWDLSEL